LTPPAAQEGRVRPELNRIYVGDALEVLRGWPDCFVDAVVTDPPYGIGLMGREWDTFAPGVAENRVQPNREIKSDNPNLKGRKNRPASGRAQVEYDRSISAQLKFQEWTRAWAAEAFRVMKPGAHLLCFASTRTYHRMACGIEDAGFEIRDQIGWLFGSGFPKSHNLKDEWKGWGTALKPAWEPIAVARKPLMGTVAENVKKWGVGAVNIDGCRVGENRPASRSGDTTHWRKMEGRTDFSIGKRDLDTDKGRWPANVIHDGSGEVLLAFPRAEDWGTAARFFYSAKASREDRNEGMDGFEERVTDDGREKAADNAYQRGVTLRKNHHPTVKPTLLMRYLCRLVTPHGGLVLDPFFGSGSTGKAAVREDLNFLGIEREAEYVAIAEKRIASEMSQLKLGVA